MDSKFREQNKIEYHSKSILFVQILLFGIVDAFNYLPCPTGVGIKSIMLCPILKAARSAVKYDYLYFCSSGDMGIASSVPSQLSLASSSSLDIFDPLPTSASTSIITNPTRKTPESFLGPNAALVNLDSLVTKPAQPAPVVNPFLASTGGRAKRMWNLIFYIFIIIIIYLFSNNLSGMGEESVSFEVF